MSYVSLASFTYGQDVQDCSLGRLHHEISYITYVCFLACFPEGTELSLFQNVPIKRNGKFSVKFYSWAEIRNRPIKILTLGRDIYRKTKWLYNPCQTNICQHNIGQNKYEEYGKKKLHQPNDWVSAQLVADFLEQVLFFSF